ncbi:hypothetical protein [Actinokineospora xionganensis]|uniref:Uncharacterized protein n=1 Tax=Actinokineospora xionganensis TaxID=2684470 RepID=A0ABR7L368_9PSEU|nr:hypothetical protein [Actinokineospora xionganensis]MBC6447134.1 hypothetical protein [Actinokineospora xionganensis]
MIRFLAILALVIRLALHRRPPGGGDGPNPPPTGKPGDGGDGKPSQSTGKVDASSDVGKAQDTTAEIAKRGRPGGEGTTGRPGEGSGPKKDPLDGKTSYGKNAVPHFRKHAQHIRTAARADGVEIPGGAGKPETQQAMKDYIQRVVDNPEQVGVGRYMSVEGAIWSRRGDLIIVRKPDGEWITALSVKSGGAAGGAPWNNPSTPAN